MLTHGFLISIYIYIYMCVCVREREIFCEIIFYNVYILDSINLTVEYTVINSTIMYKINYLQSCDYIII